MTVVAGIEGYTGRTTSHDLVALWGSEDKLPSKDVDGQAVLRAIKIAELLAAQSGNPEEYPYDQN